MLPEADTKRTCWKFLSDLAIAQFRKDYAIPLFSDLKKNTCEHIQTSRVSSFKRNKILTQTCASEHRSGPF